jgi:hypothetical protein
MAGGLAESLTVETEVNRRANPLNPPSWRGRDFKVDWIKTERLAFYRTKHIRNPWNQDLEVNVSRNGAELEPSVGQQLIDMWDSHHQTGPRIGHPCRALAETLRTPQNPTSPPYAI